MALFCLHSFQPPHTLSQYPKMQSLMMCPSYSLTSRRTQTLLNSGRKWVLCHNVWHTSPCDRPALQNWWILICHYMKMCHENWKKKRNGKKQKDEQRKWRKWSKNDPEIYQGAKKACVPSVLWTLSDNILYSEYQVFVKDRFLDMAVETKSLLLSPLSFLFFSIF